MSHGHINILKLHTSRIEIPRLLRFIDKLKLSSFDAAGSDPDWCRFTPLQTYYSHREMIPFSDFLFLFLLDSFIMERVSLVNKSE